MSRSWDYQVPSGLLYSEQALYPLSLSRLDYQPLFGKMSPHSLFGEDQRPDPGDGGNRA